MASWMPPLAISTGSLPSPRNTAHADLAAERFQLVGSGGTVDVARGEQRAVASCFMSR